MPNQSPMKLHRITALWLILPFLVNLGCKESQEGDWVEYQVARPLTVSLAQFDAEVVPQDPAPLQEPGKIYAYGSLLLVSEPGKGIHLIDNSEPESPVKIALLPVIGNRDVSIKEGVLYADSLTDLIVMDISDPYNVQQIGRLEDVFDDFVLFPFEADIVEYGDVGPDELITGWRVETDLRRPDEVRIDVLFAEEAATRADNSGVGQGGSLARFKIVGQHLYAVTSHYINVFDISDLEAPVEGEQVYAGFDIETIFNQGDMLFLGSRTGMYIYDIADPAFPARVSEFQHGTACDPVVVEGEYAYVTLRGGNDCGATESGLYIVDMTDIEQPVLLTSYPMDEPYGLGYHGSLMFVCDGDSGLKIYDKTDLEALVLLEQFDQPQAYDVIPLDSHLILIAGQKLVQFEYLSDGLEPISEFSLRD